MNTLVLDRHRIFALPSNQIVVGFMEGNPHQDSPKRLLFCMHRSLLVLIFLVISTVVVRVLLVSDPSTVGRDFNEIRTVPDAIEKRILEATHYDCHRWLFEQQPIVIESDELELNPEFNPEFNGSMNWHQLVLQLSLQQFDPDAVVAILPGEDGQPGVAGIDDNANGVTDDRSELGATHSDDRCETMSSREARQTSPRPLVLQRGAFVPVDSANAVLKDAEQRIEVLGEWKGKAFSFLLTNQTFFSNEEIP
ncbi:MAG: hypothetical protein ACPHL6_04505 [Rubripirellula sp.]